MLPAESNPYPLHFPALYFPVLAGLCFLLVELWFKRRQPWALPAAVIYGTIGAWYFADLGITPADYYFLPDDLLNFCYGQVAFFLLVYRLAVPWLTMKITRLAGLVLQQHRPMAVRTIFVGTVIFWAVLFGIAVVMMNGNVIGALFPVDARAGNLMWSRGGGASAGATGFLVSTGGYLYSLVCASFGVWVFLLRKPYDRILAVLCMMLVWPFFLLSGTRNAFLAVSLPFFFAYLLFARHSLPIKIVCLVAALFATDLALRTVITYRSIGFRNYFSTDSTAENPEELSHHQGLNMIQELFYINEYAKMQPISYGSHYVAEFVSVIPRAVWPSKPLLGIDYAIWRGFGGADNDLGVFATISAGMIGGGVLNFGRFLGPLVSALLMAVWSALLARWWLQRASLLRCFLFLAGLGLTFNLGPPLAGSGH